MTMNTPNDAQIMEQIQALVDEERSLLESGGLAGLDHDRKARLQSLEVSLDQCWDLLRQRRAKRHAGENPDEARVRDAGTVERYVQ